MMKNTFKQLTGIIVTLSIVLSSLAFSSSVVSAEEEQLDLTQSLIYGVESNSWIIHDNNLESDKMLRLIGRKEMTDGNPQNCIELSDGSNGLFKNSDKTFRNQGETLEVYHDVVFPLDEKTGSPVEVSKFYMRGEAKELSTYKFEVYFSKELNSLTDESNKAFDYTNTDRKEDITVDLKTPVIASYMLVRITMGIQPLSEGDTDWDAGVCYPRVKEIAVFGNANPDIGYTVLNDLPNGVSLSDSLISGNYIGFTANDYKNSASTTYSSFSQSHFNRLTNGDITDTAELDVIRFNEGNNQVNVGNKLDVSLDIVAHLTDKTGSQLKLSGIYVASPDNGNRTTYKYEIYVSDSLEALDEAGSLVATYTNTNFAPKQYFAFSKPVSGAYMMVRIIQAQAVQGHNGQQNAPTDYTYTRISEIAVFGENTDAYTLIENSTRDITNAASKDITAASYVRCVSNKKETQEGKVLFTDTEGYLSINNGVYETGTDATMLGVDMGDNNSEKRFNRYYSTGPMHNSGSQLDTYEDVLLDIGDGNMGKSVTFKSVIIGTDPSDNGIFNAAYKFEVYASDDINTIADNAPIAVCTNKDYSSNVEILFNKAVSAKYVMVRYIFPVNPNQALRPYCQTNITEIAVFGMENGDINDDDTVNICDLVRFKKYFADKDNTKILNCAADISGDGSIDTNDLAALRKLLLGA